jgi:hypothetical protein
MKVAHGYPRAKVERTFALHDDGTVSLVIAARRVAARMTRQGYLLIDLEESIPVALRCDGMEMKPKLILKLYCRPRSDQRERLNWSQLKHLKCKT